MDVPPGSLLQMQLQDGEWGARQAHTALARLLGVPPPSQHQQGGGDDRQDAWAAATARSSSSSSSSGGRDSAHVVQSQPAPPPPAQQGGCPGAAPAALLAFSCTGVDVDEAGALLRALTTQQHQARARVAFQGAKCGGEFALAAGGAPTLQCFTSALGLLGGVGSTGDSGGGDLPVLPA